MIDPAMMISRRDFSRGLASLMGLLTCLPICAQKAATRPPLSNRANSGEIENPKALSGFFLALADASSGRRIEPVRIMHFGDSHVAADVLTAEIRVDLQSQFGDGGAGYVVPRNPMSTRRRGLVTGATQGWQIEGIGGRLEVDRIYGPGGISLATSDPNEKIWLETSSNHFEVYYVRQPGGGTVDITIDGATILDAPLSLASGRVTTECITFDSPEDSIHRIEIRTLAPGKTRILGIVAERIVPGVSYDVLGVNGARISRLLTWNSVAFAANLAQRKPDLIILAYGTNEITDASWTPASYRRLLKTVINELRQATPQASILLFAPPDRADLPQASARMPAMIEVQRRAAFESGAAFWSAYDAMGGAGSMNSWVVRGLGQGDRVHLTRQGYAQLADSFFHDLMRAYSQSRLKSR
jgi:lysophospholipase L1-like esterase